MKPVRIKYYGLIWMTKRTYLVTTLVVGVLAVGFLLMVMVVAGDRMPSFTWPWEPRPANLPPGFWGWYQHHFWTIIIFFLFCEVLDIIITLRKFAEKEEEQADLEDEDD